MPMIELSEHEVKHIENRRRIQNERSGYCRAVRDIINKIQNKTPTSNEEDDAMRKLVMDLKRMEFPTDMRCEGGDRDARVNP